MQLVPITTWLLSKSVKFVPIATVLPIPSPEILIPLIPFPTGNMCKSFKVVMPDTECKFWFGSIGKFVSDPVIVNSFAPPASITKLPATEEPPPIFAVPITSKEWPSAGPDVLLIDTFPSLVIPNTLLLSFLRTIPPVFPPVVVTSNWISFPE